MAISLDKKWDDPYPMFLRVEGEGGASSLAYVELRWVQVRLFPPHLTKEEKRHFMNLWLEQAINERAKTLSLMKWLTPKRQETAIGGVKDG